MKQGFKLSPGKTKKVWVFGGTIAGDGKTQKVAAVLDKGYEEAVKYARKTELTQWENEAGVIPTDF